MDFDPIFEKLLRVDAYHYEPNSYTMFIFVGDRLYMIYWSDMNEEYSIVCQDPTDWLSDDSCSYDTFYAQTESGVIESINADLECYGQHSLQFIENDARVSFGKKIEQSINNEMLEWEADSDFNRGVIEGLGIALGFIIDSEEK